MVSHHPLSQFFRVFLKALFLVLYFLFFILLPSGLSSPTHLSNIISTLMTLNSLFLFLPLISRKTLLTLKQLLTLSLPGCQPICFRSISLKLNSYSLGFLNSLLKSLIQIFLCLLMSPLLFLTQHAILVSFLTHHLLCLIIFPLYLNLDFS